MQGAGGGGGYPAAGIGGGGAGAGGSTCCTGGSGYTAGSASGNINKQVNGRQGWPFAREISSGINFSGDKFVAGGYYQGTFYNSLEMVLGGYDCNYAINSGHKSGSGGKGGKGGTVKVSNKAKVYAFNGNLYTDGTEYGNGLNQAPIYAQTGIIIAKYEKYFNQSISKISEQSIVDTSSYVNSIYLTNVDFQNKKILNINTAININGNPLSNVDMSKQGIGSGAGYIEESNGTYTIDMSMN